MKGKCKDSMVNSLHKNMAYFSSVPLTVKPFVPVMIKVDWLVLHWGNAHKMLWAFPQCKTSQSKHVDECMDNQTCKLLQLHVEQ